MAPRLNRLPQRLDYTLIPAPLDLSLPSMTEKSPLPAIIVTPSSPSHTHDFSIAFLVPPPKPSFRERFSASVGSFNPSWLGQSRSFRTTVVISLLFFVMITTHLITNQLAAYPYPRLDSEFGQHQVIPHNPAASVSSRTQPDVNAVDGEAGIGFWKWMDFEMKKVWGAREGVVVERGEFVAVENTVSEQPRSLSGLE